MYVCCEYKESCHYIKPVVLLITAQVNLREGCRKILVKDRYVSNVLVFNLYHKYGSTLYIRMSTIYYGP